MTSWRSRLNWKARDLVFWALACLALLLWSGVLFVVGLSLMNINWGGTNTEVARQNLESLQRALSSYHARHHRFPTTEEELQPLVDSGFLRKRPFDPWGFPYGYALRQGRPVVWSLGADGLPGGEGDNADLRDEDSRRDQPLRCTP
ncbi:type II secretion system protein GspG [Melittangium boletus]|uniref:type II secretion system protein GspG n=1 Tax=Melittangium boletus TaxID=83453 RepID=UPI003DA2C0E2